MSKKVTDSTKADTFDPGGAPAAAAGLERPAWSGGTPLWRQCLLLAVAALLGLGLAASVISRAMERERAQMLAAIHGRADSLVWALEGGARLLDRGGTGALALLVAEVARQPGVTWIAVTDSAGRILADSNPELTGAALYSPEEMRRLAPGPVTRGRFSPDEPGIYEAWRLFAPGRLRGLPRPHAGGDARCVFVALDVSGMEEALSDHALQLWMVAALILVAACAVAGLALLFRRYRSSRRLLADAEALAGQVVRNYPSGLVVLDTAGRLRLSNARARAMLGLDGRASKQDGTAPGGKSSAGNGLTGLDWPALMAELEQGPGLLERDLELWRPQGGPLPVQLTASRLLDSGGEVLGYLFALRDMAEIRSLQRQLRQHERLSALGNLAAGLAHEIRNPLSSIRGYATYLTERLKDDPLGSATGQILIEETERLDRVLSDLLSLARPRGLEPAPADLTGVLARAVTVAAPDAAEKGVTLRTSLPEGAGACIDADRLMQAVLNLIINAIQATEPGGEVEVALERDTAGEAGWRIRVSDTGCGMPAATAAQIFTPYFTTRANGTGLGLAIARQIVEQHGGALSVSTLPGRGTTMTIRLPGGASPPAGGPA